MTEAELRQRLIDFRNAETDPGLAAAALLVAACDRPEFEPGVVHARLGAMAFGAKGYVTSHHHPRARVEGLCFYLKDVLGLHGDETHYYSRDNSCIDRVLATGRGIPITLAVIYAEVGNQVGLDCEGVNFPGHFLVRVRAADAGESTLLIDPFAGRVMTFGACQEFLHRLMGRDESLGPQHLQAASARDVLLRMLNNLKQLALAGQDLEGVLRFSERIQLVEPTLLLEHRDRALIHEKLEDRVSAMSEWQALADRLEDDDARARVLARVDALSGRLDDGRVVH